MEGFKIHTLETAPEESRVVLEGSKKKMGFVPNLLGVFAESPVALRSYLALAEQFGKSFLSEAERVVVYLTTSFENECDYCMAAHSTFALKFKVDNALVEALRRGEKLADTKLEALRAFTGAMVRKMGWISEQELSDLRKAGYTNAQVLEILVGITMKTLTNYTNHLAHPPVDANFHTQKWSPPGNREKK